MFVLKGKNTFSTVTALEIPFVAVSKTIASEKIIEAINLGCKIFGENYIQEAQEKWINIIDKYNINLYTNASLFYIKNDSLEYIYEKLTYNDISYNGFKFTIDKNMEILL